MYSPVYNSAALSNSQHTCNTTISPSVSYNRHLIALQVL
nr:MAG TPA: hypothetical protein [Caudoviricetes sp.]